MQQVTAAILGYKRRAHQDNSPTARRCHQAIASRSKSSFRNVGGAAANDPGTC
jgi:hypothetical protein